MQRFKLEPKLVEQTIAQLRNRIEDRFPNSGLGKLCAALLEIARSSERRALWLGRPLYTFRLVATLVIVALVAGSAYQIYWIDWSNEKMEWSEYIQGMEAAVNEIVLIAAAIFFVATFESRYKRRRGLKAIHELRSMAHVIDMHQLTKDPERSHSKTYQATQSSPAVRLDNFLLRRYLDYCSEMLALTGKIAAEYVDTFDDATMVSAVNEVETLTADLSRKIWQKIMILHAYEQATPPGSQRADSNSSPSRAPGSPSPELPAGQS